MGGHDGPKYALEGLQRQCFDYLAVTPTITVVGNIRLECLVSIASYGGLESVARHRGVQTLEQRQSAELTTQVVCNPNMSGKEGNAMTKPNNSGPLRSRVDRRNLFLLVLHVGVLVYSLWAHPVVHSSADRALPYAAHEF